MTDMQPEPTPGVVPVHHRIADDIRARIASGELKPGDTIPSVRELCARWGCAPGSARSALDVLKGEGLITSGRGRPATVRKQNRRIQLSMDMSQEQKELVLRPRSERAKRGAIEITSGVPIDHTIFTPRYRRIATPSDLAEQFGIEAGSDLLERTYEMTSRESMKCLAWSVSYIPVEIIKGNPHLLDESREPWPGGHFHQLYTVGIEIDRMIRSVTAIEPTPAIRQKWGMDTGVPLLCVRTKSVDVTGRVVELSDATYPADRTDIVFTEQLRRWPDGYPRFGDREGIDD